MSPTFTSAAAEDGWFVTEPIIGGPVLDALAIELEPFLTAERGHGGVRNLLDDSPSVRGLGQSSSVRAIAEAVLGEGCFIGRALLFDKTAAANWKVIWHQDLTIAVDRRWDAPEYGPWSEKAGVVHVQPPVEVLRQMVAIRVHLDDCGVENGPVRVISGTHRTGILSAAAIERARTEHRESVCVARKGAVLAFHPLLLHASSPATVASHRRVLHFEFAGRHIRTLPGGVAWRWTL